MKKQSLPSVDEAIDLWIDVIQRKIDKLSELNMRESDMTAYRIRLTKINTYSNSFTTMKKIKKGKVTVYDL